MRYINLFVALLVCIEPLQAQSWQPDATSWDNHPLRVVVIGSSTAAGAGASPIDSAWVPRFTRYLQELNPETTVTNLARGGYQTYHLMPTGNPPPPNRPWPDTARNITKALAHRPDAIIINLPSNDASAGYGVAEQLANFDTIVGEARAAGVPVWVCTTQPRNLEPEKVQVQLAVRDSILQRYGDFALNFWDELPGPGDWVHPKFDSGDGIHLNNAGHRLLFSRVLEKNIPRLFFNRPQVYATSDTLCAPGRVTLRAGSLYADTILWFDRPKGGSPLASGATLTTPALSSPVPYFVEARRGPFHFPRQLVGTTSTNRDWNGIMFELAADTSLVLDSLSVQLQSTGTQYLRVYTRRGGLSGHENEPGSWALLDSFSVQAPYEGVVVRLPVGPLALAGGDTLSLYLHLADPAGRLAYFAPADSAVARTPELRLQNGTGISHVFSERYYPRLFSGQVFYHFGYRPEGFLQTRRVPVPVFFSEMSAGIRPDSLFILADTLVLDAGLEYGNCQWSTGAQGQRLVLRARDWPPGGRQVSFQATDPYGCAVQDSLTILFRPSGRSNAGSAPLLRMIHHTGWLSVQFDNAGKLPPFLLSAEIINQTGKALYRTSGNMPLQIPDDFGPPGLYWIRLGGPGFLQIFKWEKQE